MSNVPLDEQIAAVKRIIADATDGYIADLHDDEIAALRAVLATLEAMEWRPIGSPDDTPQEHRHGNWVRVWVEAGALYAPNNGPATHYLLFPAPPDEPQEG
jgi:hypothetical protein